MRLARWALLVTCVAPISLLAEDESRPVVVDTVAKTEASTTRPAHALGPLMDLGIRQRFSAVPTTQEWAEANAYLNQNFPNLAAQFGRLEEVSRPDNPRHDEVQAQIFGRYRELMQLKDRDAKLYELKFNQAKRADEAIALVNQYRATFRGESHDNAEEIKSRLREKIREKFNLELDERRVRIERLTQQLENQKKSLQADTDNLEARLDDRVKALTPPPRFGRPGMVRPRTQRAQGDSDQ